MTVQDILNQSPYKEAIKDLCGKAEDFKHNAKKWAQNTDPDKDEVLEQHSKSSYALYQQQSLYVRDLSKRIEKTPELDEKLAYEAAKNLRGVSYNMDRAINEFINSLEKFPMDFNHDCMTK